MANEKEILTRFLGGLKMPQVCNLQVCGIFFVTSTLEWEVEEYFQNCIGRNQDEREKAGN